MKYLVKVKFNFILVKKYIKNNGLNIQKFCKLCKIKPYNYRQLAKNNAHIKFDAFNRVIKVLNCKYSDFILEEKVVDIE